MNTKKHICCFAGHSKLYDSTIKAKIKEQAETLIIKFNVKEFWVGNYGNFDAYASAAIQELKSIYPEIKLNLIIPYLTKDINEHKEIYYASFNNILMADMPENTPKRYRIIKSNEYMVNNSEFMICYVKNSFGGAYKTLQYASRKHLTIFNLALK